MKSGMRLLPCSNHRWLQSRRPQLDQYEFQYFLNAFLSARFNPLIPASRIGMKE